MTKTIQTTRAGQLLLVKPAALGGIECPMNHAIVPHPLAKQANDMLEAGRPDLYYDLMMRHFAGTGVIEKVEAACTEPVAIAVWKKLLTELNAAVQIDQVVSVDKAPGDSIAEHARAFKKVFEECRDKKHGGVVTNGGGPLLYKFRDEPKHETAEVLGVPAYDTVFYISEKGRVAATGARSSELLHLVNEHVNM